MSYVDPSRIQGSGAPFLVLVLLLATFLGAGGFVVMTDTLEVPQMKQAGSHAAPLLRTFDTCPRDCVVCGGLALADETTRCPRCRCFSLICARYPVHDVCEQHWLNEYKQSCMFCRLPVKHLPAEDGCAEDTVFFYRSSENEQYSKELAHASNSNQVHALWKKHSKSVKRGAELDEFSVCGTLQKLCKLYRRGGNLPAWVDLILIHIRSISDRMEGRSIVKALVCLEYLMPRRGSRTSWKNVINALVTAGSDRRAWRTLFGVGLYDAILVCAALKIGTSQFVEGLVERMGEEGVLNGLKGGQLCELVYKVARMGHSSKKVMDSVELLVCDAKTLHDLSPKEVCTLLQGLMLMRAHDKRQLLLVRLSGRILDRGFIDTFRPQMFDTVACAFADLSHLDVSLFQALANALMRSPAAIPLNQAQAQRILKAYRQMGLATNQAFVRALTAIAERGQTASGQQAAYCALVDQQIVLGHDAPPNLLTEDTISEPQNPPNVW